MNSRVVIAVGILAAAALVAWRAATRGNHGTSADTLEARVAATVPKVEKAVGLPFKHFPKVETRSKEQVRAYLVKQFDDPRQARDLAGTSSALKLLGLIPDSLDLRKEEENLLTEQIAGFYDPKTKVFYVIEGEDENTLDQVVPHELVHALQDQYVNLDSIENAEGDDDRQLAASSIFEGQAVYEQLVIATGSSAFAANLPAMWDRIREQVRDSHNGMPEFAKAPPIIQEVTIFPYLSGLDFVRRYYERFPNKQPYTDLPVSTQQVLSDDAYFTHRVAPLMVSLPKPASGKIRYENTFGEFQTRVFLVQHLNDQNSAIRGASGWAGDRYEVLDTPAGPALVWASVWSSAVAAGEFTDLVSSTADARFGPPAAPRTWTHQTRTTTVRPFEANGKPAVLYVDAPSNIARSLIDTAGVKVR